MWELLARVAGGAAVAWPVGMGVEQLDAVGGPDELGDVQGELVVVAPGDPFGDAHPQHGHAVADVEVGEIVNVFHDPKKGRTPFKQWSAAWLETLTGLRPTTRALYRYPLENLITPTFEELALADIDPVAVRSWRAGLEARPSISQTTAAKAYRMLSRIMAAAVEADYLVIESVHAQAGWGRALPRDAVRHPRAGHQAGRRADGWSAQEQGRTAHGQPAGIDPTGAARPSRAVGGTRSRRARLCRS